MFAGIELGVLASIALSAFPYPSFSTPCAVAPPRQPRIAAAFWLQGSSFGGDEIHFGN